MFTEPTQKIIAEKREELATLAQKVDLWISTPMTMDKQNRVKSLLEELQAKLDGYDEQFLETKLTYYRRVYELLKD